MLARDRSSFMRSYIPENVYVVNPAARFKAAFQQLFGSLRQVGALELIRKYLIGKGEPEEECRNAFLILESWRQFAANYFKEGTKDSKNIKYETLVTCTKMNDALRAALRIKEAPANMICQEVTHFTKSCILTLFALRCKHRRAGNTRPPIWQGIHRLGPASNSNSWPI